jgi:hypothetical protein
MDKEEIRKLKRIEYLKNYHKIPENKLKKKAYHKLYYASDITKAERKEYYSRVNIKIKRKEHCKKINDIYNYIVQLHETYKKVNSFRIL